MAMPRNRRLSPQTATVLFGLAAEPGEWRHGYELGQAIGLKAGTLYPILIRLAERGQVEAKWEQDAPQGRPARHLYRLSPAGAELVAELRAASAEPVTTLGPLSASLEGGTE
jgi:DNA-binding PadR family transcriptional regulator